VPPTVAASRDATLHPEVWDGLDPFPCRRPPSLRGAERRSNLRWVITPTLHPQPYPHPVIARSGREGGTAPSATGRRHAASPASRALRKRRGNPEDLPPQPRPVSFRPPVSF